MIDNLMLFLAI